MVAGEGEAGFNSGPSGDLYVFLSVREHATFTRRDYDIHSEQTISFTQAARQNSMNRVACAWTTVKWARMCRLKWPSCGRR